jgi:hypothetical protein
VTDADLANSVNPRLRAEARPQYPLALMLLHSPRPLLTNETGKYIGSEMWSCSIAAAENSSGL